MKAVILDGFTVNPGDLSWDALKSKVDELVVYERTAAEDVIERCADAEIVLTNKVILNADVLHSLPKLKYVGVLATGFNVVDTKVARELGIDVTNIPAYSTESVAQMVFCHILNIVGRVDHYARENRNMRWSNSKDFCYMDHNLIEIAGKQIGIIGLGNTGSAVARIALAFGLKVMAYTSKTDLPEGITRGTLDEVFSTSDIVSLHCPLVSEEDAKRTGRTATMHLVNKERLSQMKPSAILINTGRGPLVNDADVAEALTNGTIAAYGADVTTQEPPKADMPLLKAPNSYLTPHIAWATFEARQRLMDICTGNVEAFINGKSINVVN